MNPHIRSINWVLPRSSKICTLKEKIFKFFQCSARNEEDRFRSRMKYSVRSGDSGNGDLLQWLAFFDLDGNFLGTGEVHEDDLVYLSRNILNAGDVVIGISSYRLKKLAKPLRPDKEYLTRYAAFLIYCGSMEVRHLTEDVLDGATWLPYGGICSQIPNDTFVQSLRYLLA